MFDEGLFAPEAEGLWHLLHTKSRQEKAVSETLAAKGIRHFLPVVTQERRYGKRRAEVELPLFPGYLFLKGSLEEAYEADRTDRIAQIIKVTDQQKLLWELRNLALALAGGMALDPYPFLQKGVKVEVRSGPLRGLQGVVEDRNKLNRLVLQVNILGQATSLEIDSALLEVVAE